jgi:predicted acyl esterase
MGKSVAVKVNGLWKALFGGTLAGIVFSMLFLLIRPSVAQDNPPQQYPALPSETPARFEPKTDSFDYVRREVMIPMRDGVKLHTVILVPKGAKGAPILLTRTPYNANDLTTHDPRGGEKSGAPQSSHLGSSLYGYDNAVEVIVEGGYRTCAENMAPKATT